MATPPAPSSPTAKSTRSEPTMIDAIFHPLRLLRRGAATPGAGPGGGGGGSGAGGGACGAASWSDGESDIDTTPGGDRTPVDLLRRSPVVLPIPGTSSDS